MKSIDKCYIWLANKLNETDDENEKEYIYSISEYLSKTKEGKKFSFQKELVRKMLHL